MSEKELPEIEIVPLKEGTTKNRMRKGRRIPDKDPEVPLVREGGHHLNPVKAKALATGREGTTIDTVSQTRDIEIATDMYNMILAGKSEQDIAKKYNCTVPTVRRHLELKLSDAQDKLIMLRAKFSLLGYERIEKYIIEPTINEIEKMITEGRYDPRVYETLMKAIKLEAELVAPKNTVNINNTSGGATFISHSTSVYNRVAEAMRKEEMELGGVIIDSEDVELSSLGIDKV